MPVNHDCQPPTATVSHNTPTDGPATRGQGVTVEKHVLRSAPETQMPVARDDGPPNETEVPEENDEKPLAGQPAHLQQSGGGGALGRDRESTKGSRSGGVKKRQRSLREYLQYSPSDAVAEVLKLGPGADVPWELLEKVAKEHTDRLPIVTAQDIMMHNQDLLLDGLGKSLPGASRWSSVLKALASHGVDEQDIAHWSWILQAPSHEESIKRFVSTDYPKAVFLLLFLLRRDRNIRDPKVLGELLVYIADEFHPPRLPQHYGQQAPKGAVRQNIRPHQFGVLMSRMAHHSLRIWPSAIVSVAHIVAKWIISTPLEKDNKSSTPGVVERDDMYNRAIILFQLSAAIEPVQNMRYNWEAQRILLNLGNTLQPAMLLNRHSLRAVRRVLVALSKSGFESRTAERSARTWPPFRQVWDGLDERRKPEDYFSRSIRAGVEVAMAGYSSDEDDQALSALGGALPGQLPTIHTRSLAPKVWRGSLSPLRVFSLWAARVKATRNAQEAWLVFRQPPIPGLEPNFQVYTEMFAKLYASEVRDETKEAPGDSKESWKMHTENLTNFELVRLQPPTVDELYAQMIRGGNRPVHSCLILLVKNASSLEEGMEYVRDSPYAPDAKHLRAPPKNSTRRRKIIASLRRIPRPVFNAWIHLLCRLHLNRVENDDRENHPQRSTKIDVAIRLSYFLHGVEECEPQHASVDEKATWHTILKALAGNKTLLSRYGSHKNHHITLRNFMNVADRAIKFTGMDVVTLKEMARMSLKTLKVATVSGYADPWDKDISRLMQAFHRQVVTAFREAMNPVEPRVGSASMLPASYYDMTPSILRNYLRAMASYGDAEEVVRTVDWILDVWDDASMLQDAKLKGSREYTFMINKVLGYIKGLGNLGLIPADEMQRLDNRMERLDARRHFLNGVEETCRWAWPEFLSPDDHFTIRLDTIICKRWKALREQDISDAPAGDSMKEKEEV